MLGKVWRWGRSFRAARYRMDELLHEPFQHRMHHAAMIEWIEPPVTLRLKFFKRLHPQAVLEEKPSGTGSECLEAVGGCHPALWVGWIELRASRDDIAVERREGRRPPGLFGRKPSGQSVGVMPGRLLDGCKRRIGPKAGQPPL